MQDNAKNKTTLGAMFDDLDELFMNSERSVIYKTIVEAVEKPLIEKRDLSGASQDKPFLVIPNRDLVRLFTKLENQGFQNWSAGVLSFLVE